MEKKYNLKKKQFEEYFDLAKKGIKQDKYLNNKKIKDEQKKREKEEKKREDQKREELVVIMIHQAINDQSTSASIII